MQLYKQFEPIVSIVLPTYNREKYLKRAIDSVINQTFKDWELIVVDDGSDDKTANIIFEYQKRYENIRYLRHSNRKPPLSLNAGILATCGKFITFLGSDDEYKKEHLEIRARLLMENTGLDLLHGGFEIIGNPFVKDKNDLNKQIHLSDCTVGATFFGRRNVFLDLDGFRNLTYSDDSDFYERAVDKFSVFEIEHKTYVYYRDTPDSICTNIE